MKRKTFSFRKRGERGGPGSGRGPSVRGSPPSTPVRLAATLQCVLQCLRRKISNTEKLKLESKLMTSRNFTPKRLRCPQESLRQLPAPPRSEGLGRREPFTDAGSNFQGGAACLPPEDRAPRQAAGERGGRPGRGESRRQHVGRRWGPGAGGRGGRTHFPAVWESGNPSGHQESGGHESGGAVTSRQVARGGLPEEGTCRLGREW